MTEQPRLHHLLDRMRRGALLPAEAEQLAELVTDLETRTEQAYDLQRIAHQTSNRSEAERARAAARVTELETEVVRLRTTPAEHCGNQKPPFSEHTQRTECVLRPDHHGSHADEHGTRWWRIDDRPATA